MEKHEQITLNKNKIQVRFLNTENNTWQLEKRFPTHTELVFLKNKARHMKAKKALNMQIKIIYSISEEENIQNIQQWEPIWKLLNFRDKERYM